MTFSTGKDTFIVCRNSQGTEVRATLLRLSRYTVVFEVYNPYSILQLSEVLTEFKMIMNDRMVYSGRAVVSNLLNTGILLVCECTLEDEWLDVDLFSSAISGERLRQDFTEFLKEWEKIHRIQDDFKVVVADMQAFLMDTRRWLEQVELGIRSEPTSNRTALERDVISQLKEPITPAVGSLFERYESMAARIPEELQSIHRSYGRRQIHPLVLCAPFVYRSFQKPLGYAGDYEMVSMMLRDPLEGGSLFAKIVNYWFISAPPCEAHRNRIQHLVRRLGEEADRVTRQGRGIRILDMACGPAQEVQEFIAKDGRSDRAEFELLDFNDETLDYTGKTLEGLRQRHGRGTRVRMIKRSVNHILKETFKTPVEGAGTRYDFIYCAGLFDYLEDRICKKMMDYFYGLLAPGGLLLATNVTPANPFRNVMESFMEWHLIYRDRDRMGALQPSASPAGSMDLLTDPTGVNIFLEVRRPA